MVAAVLDVVFQKTSPKLSSLVYNQSLNVDKLVKSFDF